MLTRYLKRQRSQTQWLVSAEAFYETADDAIRSSLRLLHQICNIFGIAWDGESLQFDFLNTTFVFETNSRTLSLPATKLPWGAQDELDGLALSGTSVRVGDQVKERCYDLRMKVFCFICLHFLFLLYDSTISKLNCNEGNRARSKHRTGTWRVSTIVSKATECNSNVNEGLKLGFRHFSRIACNDMMICNDEKHNRHLTHLHTLDNHLHHIHRHDGWAYA